MSKFLAGLVTGILITTAFFILQQRQSFSSTNSDSDHLSTDSTATNETEEGSLPHDFVLFYDRFHSDSAYQLSHILFPLEGLPPDVDSLTANSGNFRWQREDWTVHQHFDSMDGNYVQQFIPIGEDMVIEQIRHAQAAYGMQRRFARMGEEWQLIYYGAMNRLSE